MSQPPDPSSEPSEAAKAIAFFARQREGKKPEALAERTVLAGDNTQPRRSVVKEVDNPINAGPSEAAKVIAFHALLPDESEASIAAVTDLANQIDALVAARTAELREALKALIPLAEAAFDEACFIDKSEIERAKAALAKGKP